MASTIAPATISTASKAATANGAAKPSGGRLRATATRSPKSNGSCLSINSTSCIETPLIPAKAGIQGHSPRLWVPAFAGTNGAVKLRLGSEDQGGGDQARDAHEHAEDEGLEGAAAALAALGAHLVFKIARAGQRPVGERALALEQALRQIFGHRVDDLGDVDGFREHLAAVAGLLQEPVHPFVGAHAHMGDGIDPQPRRDAAADAAIEEIDLFGDFLEQRAERLV